MPNATIATKILRGRSQTRPRLRMYRLRIETRGKPEQRMEVDQPVLRVGSREENDLVLDDDAVSRIHFEILVDESGHRLRDLGSTNGTFVDGFRAADIHLKPSCTITAGVTTIHFELLDAEADLPLSEGERFGPLVGRSAAMRNLFATLERVAATDTTVLIQGESGTGKELIAEAIHGASGSRADGPFVVFDCGAIAGTLLESELFGHEKGAFTGALSDRAGCLEEADGGTLFLDEIGELPIELQPKLLRAVERRELRRVGSNRTQKFDVRIIAATNRDLSAEVNRGSFRADLYYRLAVVRLEVPPLRARPEDIPVLVEHLLSALLGGNAAKVAWVMESINQPCLGQIR
jgi:transcriptional regulator of acetoin/glycerol metabolism